MKEGKGLKAAPGGERRKEAEKVGRSKRGKVESWWLVRSGVEQWCGRLPEVVGEGVHE